MANSSHAPDPFEIISSEWGEMERWRAHAMGVGSVSALAETAKAIRADTAEREQAIQGQEQQIQELCDKATRTVDRMAARIDALEAEVSQLRADQAALEPKLELDEDEPLPLPPGTPMGDDGELEASVAPARAEQTKELQASEDAGGVPLSYPNIPTSYVHSADQGRVAPAPGGEQHETPTSAELQKLAFPQGAQEQPISIDED